MINIEKIPPPWHLRGVGYILLYKFSQKDIEKMSFVDTVFKKNFAGGLGAVMIVDYKESEVGAYSELLFIPGRFKMAGYKKHHIPKIYVSTKSSVVNGRENWAIPKELAGFSFNEISENKQNIQVSSNETIFFNITLKEMGPMFPVNTALMPFPLIQVKDENYYFTKFSGRGKGKLVKVCHLEINNDFFPDITYKKPLIAIKVSPFRICFPVAEVIKK